MNFTLDDTSSELSYSQGWAPQNPSGPDVAQFFENTYHVAQFAGATLNMSVQGAAVYIYGSKGPKHANYTVQYDDAVISLSANAPDSQFQQLLFGQALDPSVDVHFISLRALPSGENDWLDVDFVTIGSSNSTNQPVNALPNTMPAPWSSSSSTSAGTTSTSAVHEVAGGASENKEGHTNGTDTASRALAIVFGIIIAIVIVICMVYWLLRRRYERRRAREHSFRMGKAEQAAVNKCAISAPKDFEHKESGSIESDIDNLPTERFLNPSANTSFSTLALGRGATLNTRELKLSQPPTKPPDSPLPSPPQSPGFASLASTVTLTSQASSSSAVTKTSNSSQKALYMIPPASPSRQSPRAFAFLSQAPSSFQMNIPGIRRMSKGDADSMKTDFLQV